MGYAKLACRNECSTVSIASNPSSAPPGECRPSSADRRHSASANSASGPRADLCDQRDHVRSVRKRVWARAILRSNNLRRPAEPLEKAYQVLDKLKPSCKTVDTI